MLALILPHAVGGMIPWKKTHEMTSPIQMMNPNRQTTYTSASLPMPSYQSFLKLDTRPMVKKVITKKSTLKMLLSAVVTRAAPRRFGSWRASQSMARKVTK